MIIDAGQLALLRSGELTIVPVMYIATPTPVRIAATFGGGLVAANQVDATGGDYLGIGTLNDLGGLTNLINGAASRADFSLSAYGEQGAELAAAFDADTDDLEGSEVNVGFVVQDADLVTVGDPFWIWCGVVDTTSSTKEAGNEAGPKRTISIGVGSTFVKRKQGRATYYTDSEQRQRSADDDFCLNVRGYMNETTKPWRA